MDDGEGVEFGFVFFEEVDAAHDEVEGGFSAFVDAVEVVEAAWAIDGEADEEVVGVEELAPVGVEECAVGLEGVVDFFGWGAVFGLEFYDAFEEVEAHEGGFAALPGEVDFGDVLVLDVLADVVVEGFGGHAEGVEARFAVGGVEFFFFEVEAVFAIEVADGADGFGHDVEGTWGGGARGGGGWCEGAVVGRVVVMEGPR